MNGQTGVTKYAEILSDMNQSGNFRFSFVSDDQGLTLFSASDGSVNPDAQSAITALIQRTAQLATQQLSMDEVNEMSITDAHGVHLVCRKFVMHKRSVYLSILMPGRNHTYRQLTNRAIKKITAVLSDQ